MATLLTEPLRAEHRLLVPKLDALRVLAAELDTGTVDATRMALDDVVSMMRKDLLPHARAEEAVLYPAVERAMGAPGAMATMVADHREIARRIEALAGMTWAFEGRHPRPDELEDLRAQLLGLWAILLLHFEKEEDVLLPVLDEHLDPDGAHALFDEMSEHTHHSGAAQ
jgi:iron-sulfur cluster repair protein YtfE (RIC family)